MNHYVLKLSEFPWTPWLFGLGISLIGGAVVAGVVMAGLRRKYGSFFGGFWIGLGERLLFTLGIAFAVPGIGVAMVAWATLKWTRGFNLSPPASKKEKKDSSSALVGGLLSMIFATLGGLICSERIVW